MREFVSIQEQTCYEHAMVFLKQRNDVATINEMIEAAIDGTVPDDLPIPLTRFVRVLELAKSDYMNHQMSEA